MNIYNNFLIILLIFCAVVVNSSESSEKSTIKARKGVSPEPDSISNSTIDLPSIGEANGNPLNKNINIKTTINPKVKSSNNSTVLIVNTQKDREGVVENHVEINKTLKVEYKNKTTNPIQINSTTVKKALNNNSKTPVTNVNLSKAILNQSSTTLKPIGNVNGTSILNSTIPVLSNNATNAKSTSTTIKPTTTTSTTTTPKPVKPKLSLSIEDYPSIGSVAVITEGSKLPVDEPIAQSSRETESRHFYKNRRHDYFIAIVSMIFILPLLMGIIIVAYRKFNEFWSTRHYRRMDFLIEGMYD